MTLDNSILAKSGIPFVYWNVEWTSGEVSRDVREKLDSYSPDDLYGSGRDLLIMSKGLGLRMKAASVLAQRFMETGNRYYRLPGEHKRTGDDLSYFDGEVYTRPFSVKMLQADALINESKGDEFDEAVVHPDFMIITELGSEWVSKYTAKVLTSVLEARMLEGLPTIATSAGGISKVMDKYGENVYSNLAATFEQWEQVIVK